MRKLAGFSFLLSFFLVLDTTLSVTSHVNNQKNKCFPGKTSLQLPWCPHTRYDKYHASPQRNRTGHNTTFTEEDGRRFIDNYTTEQEQNKMNARGWGWHSESMMSFSSLPSRGNNDTVHLAWQCSLNYALKQQSLCWFSVSFVQFLISIFHLETSLQALLTFDGLFFLLCLANNPKRLIRKFNWWNWLQTFVSRSFILIHFLYFVLQNVPTHFFLRPSKGHRCTMWPHIKTRLPGS